MGENREKKIESFTAQTTSFDSRTTSAGSALTGSAAREPIRIRTATEVNRVVVRAAERRAGWRHGTG